MMVMSLHYNMEFLFRLASLYSLFLIAVGCPFFFSLSTPLEDFVHTVLVMHMYTKITGQESTNNWVTSNC